MTSGKFLGVARKCAGKDSQRLIQDGFGRHKLVLFIENAAHGCFAAAAREHERRNIKCKDEG